MTLESPYVTVIGMGQSGTDLTETHKRLIAEADVLIGGNRHLDEMPEFEGEKIAIQSNLKSLVAYMDTRMAHRRIVVLASGDPLFYGIGAYLVRSLGRDRVRIYPNITAVGAAFSRLNIPWQDVRILSGHGRKLTGEAIRNLSDADKIAVYTSPENHPGRIAAMMREHHMEGFHMCVLERMGYPDETISWMDPTEAGQKTFQEPNMVILIRDENPAGAGEPACRLMPGTPDDRFVHEKGLITKAEVRVVAVARLKLAGHHTLWDLGAGCGSVGLEASLQIPLGQVWAVEKNPQRVAQIRQNIRRFNVKNMHVTQGNLPGTIDALPAPDRVFIGGGGRDLKAIIDASASRMKDDGVITINTVLMENLAVAEQTLTANGFTVDMVQLQVSRSHTMPYGRMLKAENPVWIITGKKR